jgi:hypothetical protein
MLIVEPAASGGHDRLGGTASSGDPGHHRDEVGAIGEDGCTLDDPTSGAVRTGQPSHQCADCFVLHNSQATPLTSSGLSARGEGSPAGRAEHTGPLAFG